VKSRQRAVALILLGGVLGTAVLTARPAPRAWAVGLGARSALLSGNGLRRPFGAAVAGNGDLFVADAANNRVVHYDSRGTFLGAIGQPAGPGQAAAKSDLDTPVGVALDGKGNIYVADLGNSRVAEYNLSGAFIGQIGARGFEAGQLLGPGAVAIGPNGDVYVLDTGADRVSNYSPQGAFVSRWGGFGSGIGEFDGPGGLTVDSKGNVFVADTNNNRVQEFSADGAYMAQWGQYGQGDGGLRYPTGVAVDKAGTIWVGDAGNSRVVLIQNPATYRGAFALDGAGGVSGIALADGTAYVVDSVGEHVLSYGPDGAAGGSIGKGGRGLGQLSKPAGVAVDAQGNVYVADTNNNRIQKFSSAGAALGVYGKQGRAPEGGSPRFLGPTAVAVDAQGNIYVADTFNSRIEKLSPSGAFVWQTPLGGQPRGVAVDAQGNVYATSYYNQQVRKFDSAGKLITLWGGRGRTNGLFLGPAAIAVDKSGRVYVADTGNSRVSIFSLLPDGSYGYSGQFGGAGASAGQFSALGGIAVAQDDTVYAVDTGGHRVQKFNPFGAHFKSWTAAAQLQSVAGLTLDGSGHVIVVDSQNNRVGVYSAAGALIRQLP